jgi:hypothetical protein
VTLGPGTSQPVKAYSPADIVRRFNLSHIDVLKVDIEGSEKAIIQKEGDFLKLAELMVIELHEGYGFDVFARDVGARGLRAYLPGQWKGNRMIVGVRGTE